MLQAVVEQVEVARFHVVC